MRTAGHVVYISTTITAEHNVDVHTPNNMSTAKRVVYISTTITATQHNG